MWFPGKLLSTLRHRAPRTQDTVGTVAYGFAQVSSVQGYRLLPRWTASAGLSYSF